MLKRNILLVFATAATFCMRAAEADSLSRWGVEVSAGLSRALAPDRYCSMFLQNRHADTDVFHQNATGFQLILQFVDTVAKGNKVTLP